nr:hypothetical protein [Edwardsiella ictaluri]
MAQEKRGERGGAEPSTGLKQTQQRGEVRLVQIDHRQEKQDAQQLTPTEMLPRSSNVPIFFMLISPFSADGTRLREGPPPGSM